MTKIDLCGGFRNFVLACTLEWKHTSAFFWVCRIEMSGKSQVGEENFVISVLRQNLHFQIFFLFVCFARYVVGHQVLADCTFGFIYLDDCVSLADGTS